MYKEQNLEKKIFYDATFSVHKYRGMGKYINNLKLTLEENFKLNCIGLVPKNYKNLEENKYHVFGFRFYFLWEQISLLIFRNRVNDLFIFPYNTSPIFLRKNNNNVLILHDLIFMEDYKSKSIKQKFGNLYRKFVLPIIIRKFEYIITVSEYSKNQIKKYFDIDENKIAVIYNAINLKGYDFTSNFRLNEKDHFFLHIGGEPDYKNSLSVVYSFNLLPSEYKNKYKLLIIGIREPRVLKEYKDVVNSLNLSNKIVFLPYQSDESIENLYKKATLFIFPSKHEGFGIPVIESLKYGCPLLCSNTSCIPEIAQEAAFYFNPNSHSELAQGIIEIVSNPKLTDERVKLGYTIVKNYSLENFTLKVSDWYKSNFIDITI
jgi:glycosyltransferase involved in cell wall biosynthesis